MRLSVIGTGYVGLVTAVCFANLGHTVIGVNRDPKKSVALNKGVLPIFEPKLRSYLLSALKKKKIRFTTNLRDAVQRSEVVFIAVGTPAKADGNADLSQVKTVAQTIAKSMRNYTVIVNKSTVPVGTARLVERLVRRWYKRGPFDVVSCPEFLREGSALLDFMKPDRIVLGVSTERARQIMLRVFAPIRAPKLVTSTETSEMVKYASNAFLATKISFINEIANICDRVGADVEEVASGMGLDPRIGKSFLRAGIGYGGSCFPKDVHALNAIAGTRGYNFRLLKAVIEVNNNQRKILFEKVRIALKTLQRKRIAVLGLAFKDHTDDIRESAAIDVIQLLKQAGASITAYDPIAMENARAVVNSDVEFASSVDEAVRGADAVIIATEWPQFRRIDWKKVRRLVRKPYLFDGKNLLDRSTMERLSFRYYAVGK